MHPVPMVRSSSIRPIFDYLDKAGALRPGLLRDACAIVYEPDGLIPIVLAGELLREGAEALGTGALGLLAADVKPSAVLESWGPVLAGARTLGQALEMAQFASPRINSAQRVWLERRGQRAILHCHLSRAMVAGRAIALEFSLMRMIHAVRAVAGPAWRPYELHLETPRPDHAARIESLAASVRYEQPSTAVVFAASLLRLRWPPAGSPTPPVTNAEPAGDFETSMRQVVRAIVEVGSADLESAARCAKVSKRTLQRRLREAGLEFAQLLGDARFEKARRMLRDPKVKIVDVSSQLGYTDSANFTRAFRRWTGVAPQRFRRGSEGAST